ncbi:MAG: AsmA-like C-terminal region-containing protein [Elusimicrobiales bacterium]|jgi:hypothetical protein
MTPSKTRKLLKQILLRIIFLPLIFAFLLLLTGTIIVRTMFTPRDLEAIVTDQLQGFFKRPVQIGSARLSFTGEIKIKGLKVIEPGPNAVNFVTADYIFATYRLAPLLHHNIVVDSVILVSPKIELIKESSGSWNFSDILEAYKIPSVKKNRLDKIDAAEIRDGVINLRYPGEKTAYSFENVNLTLKDFRPDADTPFDLSVFFKRKALGTDLEGRVYAEGVVNFSNFDLDKAEAKDLSLTFSFLNKSFKAQGSVRNFRRPDIGLTARAEKLLSSDLAPLFKSPYDFSLPPTQWGLKARMTEDKTLNFSVKADPLGLKADGFFKFSKSPAACAFTVFTPPFNLAELKKTSPDLPLNEISGMAQVRVSVNNRSGKFAMSKVVLTSNKAGFAYKNLRFGDLNLSALFSESFKNNFLNIQDGRMAMAGFRLTGLKIATRLSHDEFAGNYSALWGGAPMKGRIVIASPLTDKKTAEFTGYSKRLDLKEGRDFLLELKKVKVPDKNRRSYESKLAWVKTVKNSIPSGFAAFRLLYKADFLKHEYFYARGFYLSADLRNIAGQIEKLRGDVSIKSGSGTFYNVQKTSERDRLYYILSLPVLTMYRLNRMGALKFGYKLTDVNFSSIGGDYRLDSGKINIRNFYMAGREFSIYTTGALDLANENIKLKVYTISDKYYSMGSLPETMTDASGKPALAFTIEGKMNKPTITMMNPKEAGSVIAEAIKKGVAIDLARINKFAAGGK